MFEEWGFGCRVIYCGFDGLRGCPTVLSRVIPFLPEEAGRLSRVVDMTNIETYNVTMISLNINEVKTHFSSCLAKVSNGETVIICKRNVPIAEIKPIAVLPNKKRPIGLAGKEYPDFQIGDAFFEPLPDDVVATFSGEEA